MKQNRVQKPGALPGGRAVRRVAVCAGVALLVLLAGAANAGAAQVFTGQVSHVPDGDTVWVLPDGGGPPRKLRLAGIDAPEICQPAGPAAQEALAAMALRQHVEVTLERYDDYGRGLARIRLAGEDVGARMVREGHAWSYRYRRDPGPYMAEETMARVQGRGLFAQPLPEVPRQFRQRHGPCPMLPRPR